MLLKQILFLVSSPNLLYNFLLFITGTSTVESLEIRKTKFEFEHLHACTFIFSVFDHQIFVIYLTVVIPGFVIMFPSL